MISLLITFARHWYIILHRTFFLINFNPYNTLMNSNLHFKHSVRHEQFLVTIQCYRERQAHVIPEHPAHPGEHQGHCKDDGRVDPVLGQVVVHSVPHTPPVTHHNPARDVQVKPAQEISSLDIYS